MGFMVHCPPAVQAIEPSHAADFLISALRVTARGDITLVGKFQLLHVKSLDKISGILDEPGFDPAPALFCLVNDSLHSVELDHTPKTQPPQVGFHQFHSDGMMVPMGVKLAWSTDPEPE
ncbi:hypothetical protein PAAG_05464 [Paracoccidioides lutzii Pb01]|uniref:Uncharacterized protein n=1 Tax=Paracoccidioides lutzii (strain ATCC MYA-826 / Pb01) TaxID=502779 RepID=C1H3X1_PARBA|nr:hypothetical protein PAAG_05464 [Paracoccidioides lutzii Pb01]EEH34415.1 hypothetical protein PAAG_05464 [Paracoccidioides lutzii Pb01]